MIIGKGSKIYFLTVNQVHDLCAEAFKCFNIAGKRILAIIPDHTRTAPIDLMFRVVYQLLADRLKHLDFMIVLGTYLPMSEAMINERVGITSDLGLDSEPQPNQKLDTPIWDVSIAIVKIFLPTGDFTCWEAYVTEEAVK